MRGIGGFLELELNLKSTIYKDAFRLNSGRNALRFILKNNNYKKIYLPDYICDAVINTINELGIEINFYTIDKNLEFNFDISAVNKEEAFLYINYFGLKDTYIDGFIELSKNIIIDNSQAFYSKHIVGSETFYSPRKFLGVPDGGYAYISCKNKIQLEKDQSCKRCQHLLERKDEFLSDQSYKSYLNNEEQINNLPLMEMSILTNSLINNIEHKKIIRLRKRNYNYVSSKLKHLNSLTILDKVKEEVPMAYPFFTENSNLKNKLLKNKVYIPTYWNNTADLNKGKVAKEFSSNLLALPVDQRLNKDELDFYIKIIENYYEYYR